MNNTASILLAVAALVVAMAVIGLVAGLILHLRHRATRDAARDASDEAREVLSLERQQARDAQIIELIPKFAEMISPGWSGPRSRKSFNDDIRPGTDDSRHEPAVDVLAEHLARKRHRRDNVIRRTIVLPMNSKQNILPNTSAQISTTTKSTAFRPTRIVVGGNPAHWIINILKIGNRDQGIRELPGEMFAAAATGMFISAETVQVAMEISITVTYVGPLEQGEEFSCGIVGDAVDSQREDPSSLSGSRKHTLAIRSYAPTKHGESIVVASVPHSEKLIPERIVICGNPKNWEVSEIMSGQHSQLAQRDHRDSAPGEMFTAGLELKMDAIDSWERFSMHVTYVGDQPNGEEFSCIVQCAVAEDPPLFVTDEDLVAVRAHVDGIGSSTKN